MTRTIITLVFFYTGMAFASMAHAADELAVLSIGRSTNFKVPKGLAVSVSNGSVIHATDLGDQIRIVGKKIGSATVRAGQEQLLVHVIHEPERRLYSKFIDHFKTMRGISLQIDGTSISISGQLLRFDDWLELSAAASSSDAHYSFQAELSSELKNKATAHFNALFRSAHMPEFPIEFQPKAVVTVSTEPSDLKARVEQIVRPYGFKVESTLAALSLEPMVRVRLIVAEFRKNQQSKLGLSWPESETAQLLPNLKLPTSLNVSINALEERGLAKVLASPTLLCRSGKEAEFLAGGEFPIKVVNFKIQDIVWKKYGVMLRIKPRADYSGRMSIGIETEVSMIDDSLKVDGLPALMTNRIDTHFDLTGSRTIVLSGLIKKEWGEKIAGLPGLSGIPVLGQLFGSRDYREHRSELVVFVTPELARPDQDDI